MFAATKDDKGIWRLSIRRIRIIKTIQDGKDDLSFPSQAKAKACADELNDKMLSRYEAHFNPRTAKRQMSNEECELIKAQMMDIIIPYTGKNK